MTARWTRGVAALVCALSVALGAYASHAASAQASQRLALAASFAFAHALALILLAPRAGALAIAARTAILLGIVLFCGSLAAAALFGAPTMAAPLGGLLFIIGWLLAAIDYLRTP